MKFKIEVALLVAITLFAVAVFFYSYQTGVGDVLLELKLAFPYRGVALRLLASAQFLWLQLLSLTLNEPKTLSNNSFFSAQNKAHQQPNKVTKG